MKPGDTNKNGQHLLRKTSAPGSDHNARIWILTCRHCNNVYGCNNTDAFQRKCPKCQNGRPGEPLPAERDGAPWSDEDHKIAFLLYNDIPFGTIHIRNPKIIELAAILGRKPGSISLKLANFARLDPALQARGIRGMSRGAKGEESVWQAFTENPEQLAYESARLLAQRLDRPLEDTLDLSPAELPPPGLEREALVRLRVNQDFFRRRVLSAYNYTCCVTGLTNRALLTASHIVPWSKDPANRLNPRNGLCLNALHDRAFDRGLMWVKPDFTIRLSPNLVEATSVSELTVEWLRSFDRKPLVLPKQFQPDPQLLALHASSALPIAMR